MRANPPHDATLWRSRQAALQHSLEALSQERNGSETYCIGQALLGGLTGGWWLYTALDDGGHQNTKTQALLGSLSLALAGIALSQSVACLFIPDDTDSDRLRRWHAALDGNSMDPQTLAGFEGELRAEQQAARRARYISGVRAVGSGLAALTLIALAATPVLERDAETYAYLAGSIHVTISAWQIVRRFSAESPHERNWQYYHHRTPYTDTGYARDSGLSIRLHGLGVAGTF